MKSKFNKWWDYWKEHKKSIVDDYDFVILIVVVVSTVIWFSCWYNGTNTPSDKLVEDISLPIALLSFLFAVTWFPVKIHHKTKSDHAKDILDIKREHAIDIEKKNMDSCPAASAVRSSTTSSTRDCSRSLNSVM
jgi:hypothetical protein